MPSNSTLRGLHGLLSATVSLPILVFFFGTRQGEVVFVLYREPKLAAIQILGWSLLGCLFWTCREEIQVRPLLEGLLRPPWRWLALFLAYGLVTGLWIEVPANLFYELSQSILLLLLVLTLGVWRARDPAVPRIVEQSLVLSLGFAVLVGLIQGVFPLAILSPIDPGSGSANPSLLGYKNVMALAVMGQIFLLTHLVSNLGWSRRGRLLGILLGAELVYLASLGSRTSYLGLLGGAVFLVVLQGRRARLRAILAGGLAASLFLAAVAVDPESRSRAVSAAVYLGHPMRYLESDRGTYLLNSIQMVRSHPLGIGLGDWQTQYPLYRLHRRDLYFTERIQVRRAHSDHVQAFAETGWPGLILWVAFWVSLSTTAARGSPLLAAQVVAYGFAMLTDSVIEHPYLKLEFFLVMFLAVPEGAAATRVRKPGSWPARVAIVLAVAGVGHGVCLARKAFLASEMAADYVAGRFEEGARAGEAMARTPGYFKGLSDDYRVLAQLELEQGRRRRALVFARRSLHFHPYSPNTFRLMADLLRERRPSAAARWSRAADYVMNQTTRGFDPP